MYRVKTVAIDMVHVPKPSLTALIYHACGCKVILVASLELIAAKLLTNWSKGMAAATQDGTVWQSAILHRIS